MENLNHDMEKYKILDLKINKLARDQKRKPVSKIQFYPRVLNNTNIEFSDEEVVLLNKGLKNNLLCNKKYWLSNLALESEAAVMTLPVHEQEYVRYQVTHNLQKLYKRSTITEIDIDHLVCKNTQQCHQELTNLM
jgi:hypothetical protein